MTDVPQGTETSEIKDEAVTTGKIADKAVTAAKLGDDVSSLTSVDDSTIETNAGALRIKDAGVTAAKLATDAAETAKIKDKNVTYAKIQDVSATDKLLGRSTAGAGAVEEIACTSAGRALLDDANAAAQRTTLGLGTMATRAVTSGDGAPSSTPAAIGDIYVDTTAGNLYFAKGTSSSADWVLTTPAAG